MGVLTELLQDLKESPEPVVPGPFLHTLTVIATREGTSLISRVWGNDTLG